MTIDKAQRFHLKNFQNKKSFTGFLPGIAGPFGIPMWVFYVNRGQAIASFGIESKNQPLMEFQPANKAYQLTPLMGFRTFMRISDKNGPVIYEPFGLAHEEGIERDMFVSMNELEIQEVNPLLGIQTNVLYFTIPSETFAGLVRQVTVTNTCEEDRYIEILDGAPSFIPFGVNNGDLKDMGRTIEAWMAAETTEQGLSYFRVRASTGDSAEVREVTGANYSIGLSRIPGAAAFQPMHSFVDPAVIFAADTSYYQPKHFYREGLSGISAMAQTKTGRTPCAFSGAKFNLSNGQSAEVASIFGYASNPAHLQAQSKKIVEPNFFASKREEGKRLIDQLTAPIITRSKFPQFDAYARQTFLDNTLRGGQPAQIGSEKHPHLVYMYSRKHGDPERDYNFFSLSPTFFSEGEGNFRDVAQNRRSDVFFSPFVGQENIHTFLRLIQLDGYNPLVVQGGSFALAPNDVEVVCAGLSLEDPEMMEGFLAQPFTLGELFHEITKTGITNELRYEEILSVVLEKARKVHKAAFGEGFWIDHWTYIIDLIESYLAVFPDKLDDLLHGNPGLPFFDSPAYVQPRENKYVLTDRGPRQYYSLAHDHEKAAILEDRWDDPNWMRTQHGNGNIYFASVFAKLFMLACLKTASLDPYGMGVEMEAGKPGWYDALNGLPGLLGSSMPETYEILRLTQFLQSARRTKSIEGLRLPEEFCDFQQNLVDVLNNFLGSDDPKRDFSRWDAVSTERERFRQRTRFGIHGLEKVLKIDEIDFVLETIEKTVRFGIARANEFSNAIILTYFQFEVTQYESRLDDAGNEIFDELGRAFIRPTAFNAIPLPAFLEGPVRALKVSQNKKTAQKIIEGVENSGLFDPKLKMYKVNTSLKDVSHEIGRARAFPRGWLENESIWLHMEYKYLLSLLEAEQYAHFWEISRNTLIPFLDPEMYGRSTLENSSFLASSAHPDPDMHGRGFVARLSGATAEFISIWLIIMFGKNPFTLLDGQLCLILKPTLPGWFFTDEGQIEATFLGHVRVIIHNPQKVDTWRETVQKTHLFMGNEKISISGAIIPSPYAQEIRSGNVTEIQVFY